MGKLTTAMLLGWALLSAGCKERVPCDNSTQCEEGYECTAAGKCELASDGGGGQADANLLPACPEATHQCEAAAPDGWTGPVIGAQAAQEEALPACPDAYTEEAAVFEGLVESGDCSCDCSGVASVSCSDGTLSERTSSNCSILICSKVLNTCDSRPLSPGSCSTIPSTLRQQPFVQVYTGKVESTGNCVGDATPSNTLTASFASQERYCTAESLEASCPGNGACMPTSDSEEFAATCIFQEGDHECPESYPARELRAQGLSDDRSCSTCSCEPPAVNADCGGSVVIGNSCVSEVAVSSCMPNPFIDFPGYDARYTPLSTLSCTASAVSVAGEVTQTGVTTFCCSEEIPPPTL